MFAGQKRSRTWLGENIERGGQANVMRQTRAIAEQDRGAGDGIVDDLPRPI